MDVDDKRLRKLQNGAKYRVKNREKIKVARAKYYQENKAAIRQKCSDKKILSKLNNNNEPNKNKPECS